MFNSFFKERRASLFYLLLTVTAMMVSGCDNNVDNSIIVNADNEQNDIRKAIVGKWELIASTIGLPQKTRYITFNEDGTYVELLGTETTGTGTYSIHEEEGTMPITDDEIALHPYSYYVRIYSGKPIDCSIIINDDIMYMNIVHAFTYMLNTCKYRRVK